MNDFKSFGDPVRFEIAARWAIDTEPRERLPRDGGWSTCDLRITVGNQVLTARRYNGSEHSHLAWYLAPLLDWLLSNWTSLLHEEAYAWPEKGGAPAAWAVFAALGRCIASSDETEQINTEKCRDGGSGTHCVRRTQVPCIRTCASVA